MDAPNEFQPLMDDIFREKVLRARAQKVKGELSLEGFELFESGLLWMRAGVRRDRPQASDEEVEGEIRRRLAIGRRLNERGIYQTLP